MLCVCICLVWSDYKFKSKLPSKTSKAQVVSCLLQYPFILEGTLVLITPITSFYTITSICPIYTLNCCFILFLSASNRYFNSVIIFLLSCNFFPAPSLSFPILVRFFSPQSFNIFQSLLQKNIYAYWKNYTKHVFKNLLYFPRLKSFLWIYISLLCPLRTMFPLFYTTESFGLCLTIYSFLKKSALLLINGKEGDGGD